MTKQAAKRHRRNLKAAQAEIEANAIETARQLRELKAARQPERAPLTNAQRTEAFLASTDSDTYQLVLSNVAQHYGITIREAHDELTHPEAEHLLDYVTGPDRMGIRLLMERHGLL
jgi:uncharacterized membrane protein